MTHDERIAALAEELERQDLVVTAKPTSVRTLTLTIRHPKDANGHLTERAVIWQDEDRNTRLDVLWQSRTVADDEITEVAGQVARAVTPVEVA